MCGKYFINQELLYDLRKQFPEIGTADSGLFPGDAEKTDIVPGMNVPVLYCSCGRTVCSPMIWGFPDSMSGQHRKNKSVIHGRKCRRFFWARYSG